MDAFSSPKIETVVLMCGSQLGKTEIVNNVVGFYVDQDPSPMLVIQPTQKPMAEAWSKDRLAPMIRDTPCLQGKVKEPRSRDSGNTILHKEFPGGHITIAGANSPAGLASRPIRILLCDELDRYPASAGEEGDPVELATARTSTFWNRKILLVSSPTIEGGSRIARAFEQSDQRRFYVPCPECGVFQVLQWKGIVWARNKPETAAYACRSCAALIPEHRKPGVLRRGEWRAENPGHTTAGFHLSALYSPWRRWAAIAEQFLKAKGNSEMMRVFTNTVLGELWTEEAEQADPEMFTQRREAYRADVPDGVGVLTAAIDVQGDRIELEVRGWGKGEESWLISHARIYGEPEGSDVWARAERLLAKSYRHEHGADLRIRAVGVDTGTLTRSCYTWIAPRQRRGVRALKGVGGRGKALLGRPAKRNKLGVRLWPVGVETAKDSLFARLKMTIPGPGYLHFPLAQEDGADDEYLRQYAGERAVTRFHKGFKIREYVKVRDRNEAIDLYVYNLAALYSLGRGVTEYLGQLADTASEPVAHDDDDAEEAPEAPPRRRTTRKGGWLRRG